MDLSKLITGLTGIGWVQIGGIVAVLLVMLLVWLNWRSISKREKERKNLEKEKNTYQSLSETLARRKADYDELLRRLKNNS